jgi:hypothetical protein
MPAKLLNDARSAVRDMLDGLAMAHNVKLLDGLGQVLLRISAASRWSERLLRNGDHLTTDPAPLHLVPWQSWRRKAGLEMWVCCPHSCTHLICQLLELVACRGFR